MKRILSIRQGAIGDVIVTMPTIALLRDAYPDAYIEVIGNEQTLKLAVGVGYADKARAGERALTTEMYKPNARLSDETVRYFSGFDIVLAYMKDKGDVIEDNITKCGAGRVIKIPPFPKGEGIHAADYSATILNPLGIAPISLLPPLIPRVNTTPEDRAFATEYLERQRNREPLVALHPRTWGEKAWPMEGFIEIAQWVRDGLKGTPVWIIGPVEEESEPSLTEAVPEAITVRVESLRRLASILALCDIYLGCDTGISHLAAASGVPTAALFGATDPRVWAPRGDCAVFVLKADTVTAIDTQTVKGALTELYKTRNKVVKIIDV